MSSNVVLCRYRNKKGKICLLYLYACVGRPVVRCYYTCTTTALVLMASMSHSLPVIIMLSGSVPNWPQTLYGCKQTRATCIWKIYNVMVCTEWSQ